MKRASVYKPVVFFLVTNLIMWSTWSIVSYFSFHKSAGAAGLASLFEIIGLLSPLVTALGMIYFSKNKELKKNFKDRLLNVRLIKPSTLSAILFIMPLTVVISVYLSHIFFGLPLSQMLFDKTPFAAGLIPIPLLLFGAALVEELGWKGYGVDSLRGRRTFFTVTLLYAALWALWHVPTFFVNGYYQNMLLRANPWFAVNFIVSIFPAAFIINWLWYRNNGSILTAVLVHAITNVQGLLQMGQVAKCIQTAVMIVFAAIIVALNKKIFFKEFPARIGYYGQRTASPKA
jgi:membrane protease YdiL (CAAX protease family)